MKRETRIGDSTVQITPIQEVLTTRETHEGANGHQPPIGEFKILMRNSNKHLTFYGGSLKTLNMDKATSPTPEGGNFVKASPVRYWNSHGDTKNPT